MHDKLTVNHPARRIFRFIESRTRVDGTLNSTPDDKRFNELALELFAYQFEQNASYRRFCELRKLVPGSFVHWTKIPTVPTTAFKEFELSCLPHEQQTTVFHSSGTTGQKPSRHFHSIASLEIYHASLCPWFRQHVIAGFGLMPKASFLSLTPTPEMASHSSLAHMFGVVISEFGTEESMFAGTISDDGDWEVDAAAAMKWIQARANAGEPVVVLGTAFNFVHLLDRLDEKGLSTDLPAGSTVMETGGYKGRSRELPKEALHQLITSRLGVTASNIICEYGMSELSSQAYDQPASSDRVPRSFRFPPWARARIVSPESGDEVGVDETGLVQVFDLANTFSVMAIQTEDLAIRRQDGFELIGRASAAEPRGCSLTSL